MGRIVILPAGGQGLRMGGDRPKQFFNIGPWPIVVHSAKAFLRFDPNIRVIIAVPELNIEECRRLFPHYFDTPVELVIGGASRYHSVKNAVETLPDDAWVAVHDAVRPFVSVDLIARSFDAALCFGNSVPAIAPSESVRLIRDGKAGQLDRNAVRLIQTPQVFWSKQLKEAYQLLNLDQVTDDSSLVEALGVCIHLIEGERGNIKITFPEDLYQTSIPELPS